MENPDHGQYVGIQPKIRAALDRYISHGTEAGGFVEAVLRNDLMEAVVRADPDSLDALRLICHYIYNELPSSCHGGKEAVAAWRVRLKQERERKDTTDGR